MIRSLIRAPDADEYRFVVVIGETKLTASISGESAAVVGKKLEPACRLVLTALNDVLRRAKLGHVEGVGE